MVNAQLIIVILLITGAVLYILKSMYKSAKGHTCEQGSCKCSNKKVETGN